MRPDEGDAIPCCEIDHIYSGQDFIGGMAEDCYVFDAPGSGMIPGLEQLSTSGAKDGVENAVFAASHGIVQGSPEAAHCRQTPVG
jgi:hypothetical protein